MSYGFFFDNSRCTGCKTCELACKDYKDLDAGILFRKVYDYEGGTWTQDEDGAWTTTCFAYHVSVACNHCASPACMAFCPESAIVRDEETDLVRIDPEFCIGCGTCVKACPYEVPRLMKLEEPRLIEPEEPLPDELEEEQEATEVIEIYEVAVKCDGCLNRVMLGKQPICVDACPLRALDFGDITVLQSHYGTITQIPPLPEPFTEPRLVIKPSAAAKGEGVDNGYVANISEII